MANLKEILNRKGEALTEVRADNLLKSGLRASEDYVRAIEKELLDLEEEAQDCLAITASTDANAGQKAITNDDLANTIEEYHQITLKIETTKLKLKIAKKVHAQLKG